MAPDRAQSRGVKAEHLLTRGDCWQPGHPGIGLLNVAEGAAVIGSVQLPGCPTLTAR
jgi:hypothetical protein